MHPRLRFPWTQSFSDSLSISNLNHLHTFQNSTFRSLSHIANLPIIDSICSELLHHFLFPLARNTNQQATTGLSRISLHELEVLNLIFNFDQPSINRQFVDDQFYIGFLSLCQIVCMTEDAEASDIGACACIVLTKEAGPDQAQSGHLFLSAIEGLQQFRLTYLLQDLFSFLLACLQPLHGVDGKTGTEWFGEDYGIARLSIIGHDKLLIFYHCNGTATHHWPLVIYCLSASYLCSCLLRCIGKALNHQSGGHVFLDVCHLS